MSERAGSELWEFLDAHRGDSRPEELIREWVAAGRDYRKRRERLRTWITARGSAVGGQFFSSPDLVDFMGEVVAATAHGAESVLDPVCGSGFLLGTAADATGASVIHGVDIDPSMSDLARLLLPEGAEVFPGDVLADEVPLQPQYALVVAEPPFGLRLAPRWPLPGADDFPVSHFSNALAWWGSLKLSDRGTAVLLLSCSFIHERAKRGWGILERQGIHVRACVHVPRGSIQGAGVEAYVVVVDRQERDEIFAAQFTPDAGHQGRLVENLAAHRHARYASQGRLWSWESFTGFAAIETRERVRAVGKRMGLAPVPIREFVTEHRVLSPSDLTPPEGKPNAVYLPLRQTGRAVIEPAEIPAGTRQYLQLCLDVEKADARYVAGLLGQEIGQALLDGVRGASAARDLLPAKLMELDLYLPPLETQRKIADAVSEARRHRAQLDELEHSLWTLPDQAEQTAGRIASFRREERYQDWLEAMPFPLASILWRHHASSGSPHERAEILLKFFEGLAQFLATVHLSAWVRDQDLWAQHGPKLYHILEDQHLAFERATFGLWKCVVEYLSAQARRMRSSSPEGCFAMYRTRSLRVLDMVCHPGLQAAFQLANTLRNRHAHGGLMSARHAEGFHQKLLELVDACRAAMGQTWDEFTLVQPEECRIRDGVYSYRARRIMGTRTPFETVVLECVEALEDGALYLMQPEGDRGLLLLPFVRVMASPETEANACYFYSRTEDATTHYVSYHFDAEPEVECPFDDTMTALARLRSAALGPDPRGHEH